jgi:hypothetical protein
MKLEDQVVSLELAKKLKELGVKQQSLYSHGKHGDIFQPVDRLNPYVLASAFTVAELGEILSDGIEKSWKGIQGVWRCSYTYLATLRQRKIS